MNRPYQNSFFAIEVISLCSFHDDFFPRISCHCPFSAVGIITGISRRAAASRIIGDHIINKVLIIRIPKLMRFPWLKEKCVTRSHFGYPVLIPHIAATGNNQIEFRFRRMRVIGTKEFAFAEFGPTPNQTDAASTDRATPVRAQARPKYFS